jgi:hypothetical protein
MNTIWSLNKLTVEKLHIFLVGFMTRHIHYAYLTSGDPGPALGGVRCFLSTSVSQAGHAILAYLRTSPADVLLKKERTGRVCKIYGKAR